MGCSKLLNNWYVLAGLVRTLVPRGSVRPAASTQGRINGSRGDWGDVASDPQAPLDLPSAHIDYLPGTCFEK
ncbi:hypothetical protein AAFF_G00067110 [Aldrovandia affinis]|uniref:Uncharacterized protein n=1 Tax=Aldrovandia affinis TaxID=143900 RepID=A0AAD7T4C2_9TELE|nr:hypothetical protein AAFF_G00067110 [Aldrovandia affinis]